MAAGELIEQLALHVRAGEAVELLLQLALDQAAQLLFALETERLGEVVIDDDFRGLAHFTDDDVEGGVLAGEIFIAVIFREGDVQHLLVIGLHADELILEAGDELTRPDLYGHAFALAALEGNAVDLALKIDQDHVAVLRLVALGGGFKVLLILGQTRQRLVHLGIGRLDGQTLQRNVFDRGRFDVGQHFKAHVELGVLAGLIAVLQRNVGLDRRAKIVFADRLLNAVLDGSVQRVLHQSVIVHLAHQIGGHLAGAEAGHADLRGDLLHLAVDAGLDLAGRNGDGVGALQAFVQRFGALHDGLMLFRLKGLAPPTGCRFASVNSSSYSGLCGALRVGSGAGEGTRTPTSYDTWT